MNAQEIISTYVSASELRKVTSEEALEAGRFLAKYPEIIPEDYLDTVYNLADKHKWNSVYFAMEHDGNNFGMVSAQVLTAVGAYREKVRKAQKAKTPIGRLRVLLGF